MSERSWIKKIEPAFEDARGLIADVFDGEDIRHIGFITSKKGAVRGNHYHKLARQYTYVLRGKMEWYTKDTTDPNAKAKKEIVEAGHLTFDAPLVAHAFIALEDTEFIFFTNEVRTDNGYEKDTFRVTITG